MDGSTIFLGFVIFLLFFGLPLILYLIYNSVNSIASNEVTKK